MRTGNSKELNLLRKRDHGHELNARIDTSIHGLMLKWRTGPVLVLSGDEPYGDGDTEGVGLKLALGNGEIGVTLIPTFCPAWQ